MLYPTINELTKGDFNRYELSLATARCARIVTDEYVKQREDAEKAQTGNKETDKPINTLINKELRDEKAVHVAVNRLNEGLDVIDPEAGDIAAIEAAAAEKRAAEEAAALAAARAAALAEETDEDEEGDAAEEAEDADELDAAEESGDEQ